eukprot:1159396-Pelagomonas_calceolata.AAC.2
MKATNVLEISISTPAACSLNNTGGFPLSWREVTKHASSISIQAAHSTSTSCYSTFMVHCLRSLNEGGAAT